MKPLFCVKTALVNVTSRPSGGERLYGLLRSSCLTAHPRHGIGRMTKRRLQMKTVRIREKIKKFLGDRPRNTAEILEHINSTMRHGTTSQQLGNVLSKDKDIVKVGYIKRSGILSGGYDICEWATRTWVSDNCPDWQEGQPLIIDSEGNVQTNDLIRRN